MPQPDNASEEEQLRRLDDRLDALQASRARDAPKSIGDPRGAAAGYRFLGEVLGGALGGFGLGWLLDRFAHTAPWGMVGGPLIGLAVSLTVAVMGAARAADAAAKQSGPLPSVPDDEDDE
jgi:ATP synthase protein I